MRYYIIKKVCHTEVYRPVQAIRTDSIGYRYTDRPVLLQYYTVVLL